MTMVITHAFVNPKADGADATIVRPSDWNANHALTGLISSAQMETTAAVVTVGTTPISGGTSGRVLYDNAAKVGELATTGTAGNVVLSAGPTLTGTLTAAAGTYSGDVSITSSTVSFSSSTGALTVAGGVGVGGSINLAGSFNITNAQTASDTSIFGSLLPNLVNGNEAYLILGKARSVNQSAVLGFHYDSAGATSYANLQIYGGSGELRINGNGDVSVTTGGVVVGSPTGGNKGAGTINATAVYDDGTLLTCFAVEYLKHGRIDLARWDAVAPNGRHELAHRFVGMLDRFDPLDPRAYIKRMLEDEALPGMPTAEEWQHGALSIGALQNRLWLALELLALAFAKAYGERSAAV